MTQNEDFAVTIAQKLLSQDSHLVSLDLDDIPDGLEELRANYDIVSFAERIRAKLDNEGDARKLILAFPMEATRHLTIEIPSGIDIDQIAESLATIYLHGSDDFLIEANEEYRRVIKRNGVNAIFRSWRTAEGAKHDWEYENCIFLWMNARTAAHKCK